MDASLEQHYVELLSLKPTVPHLGVDIFQRRCVFLAFFFAVFQLLLYAAKNLSTWNSRTRKLQNIWSVSIVALDKRWNNHQYIPCREPNKTSLEKENNPFFQGDVSFQEGTFLTQGLIIHPFRRAYVFWRSRYHRRDLRVHSPVPGNRVA